jgi:hypothetical protein
MKSTSFDDKNRLMRQSPNKAAMDEINGKGETPIIERPSRIPEKHR